MDSLTINEMSILLGLMVGAAVLLEAFRPRKKKKSTQTEPAPEKKEKGPLLLSLADISDCDLCLSGRLGERLDSNYAVTSSYCTRIPEAGDLVRDYDSHNFRTVEWVEPQPDGDGYVVKMTPPKTSVEIAREKRKLQEEKLQAQMQQERRLAEAAMVQARMNQAQHLNRQRQEQMINPQGFQQPGFPQGQLKRLNRIRPLPEEEKEVRDIAAGIGSPLGILGSCLGAVGGAAAKKKDYSGLNKFVMESEPYDKGKAPKEEEVKKTPSFRKGDPVHMVSGHFLGEWGIVDRKMNDETYSVTLYSQNDNIDGLSIPFKPEELSKATKTPEFVKDREDLMKRLKPTPWDTIVLWGLGLGMAAAVAWGAVTYWGTV